MKNPHEMGVWVLQLWAYRNIHAVKRGDSLQDCGSLQNKRVYSVILTFIDV